MSTPATATTHDHLIRGHEYLEQYPHFELVGRDDILRKLTAGQRTGTIGRVAGVPTACCRD
jgi:hypothetical protein